MKLNEVKYDYKSKQYLAESWNTLTEAQQVYVGKWEKNVWPLVENYSKLFEAELSQQQIQDIFKKAEKVAVDSGGNATVLGKAGKISGQVAGKLKSEIEKLAKAAQDSGPIQDLDSTFDRLRKQVADMVGEGPGGNAIIGIINKWKDYTKENPAKAAFCVAALTSALAFASGGIVSGMAIGFFVKLANNVLTGDKLSSAVAKTGKQMAIGALAGGIGKIAADAAADLFPAEVVNIFTSSDGSTIDLSQVEAMNMTADQLDADAVKELLQTRNAFLGLAKDLVGESDEAQQAILDEIKKINTKIFELEPTGATANEAANNLANEYGIVGDGVNLEKSIETGEEGADGEYTSTETVEPAGEIPAEKLQAAGLDYATQPELSDEFKEFLAEKGIDEDTVQAQAGFDRASANETWLGVRIGGADAIKTFDGQLPNNINPADITNQIDIPDDLQMGQTWQSEITTTFDGLEGQNLTYTAEYMFEGVDADGNDIYSTKSIYIAPESRITDAMLENLSEEDADKFWDLYGKYVGEGIGEEGVESYLDDLNQKLANGFAGAIATVGLAGAVANAENKQAKESYRKNVENILMEKYLEEGPALDAIKKAAMATVKGVGTVADKAVGGVSSGAMKVAQKAIQTGKAVGKELGNKITYKKLMSMWKTTKKPTDVAGIVQVLQRAGMSDDAIGLVDKESDADLALGLQQRKDQKAGKKPEAEPTDDKKDTETKPGDENPANFVDVEALAKIIKANELDDEVRAILAKSAKAA